MKDKQSHIEKLAEDTMQSLDGINRAEGKPFLLTRVMAAIDKQRTVSNQWTRIAAFISKPGIAACGILLIMFVNVAIYVTSKKQTDTSSFVQNYSVKDEFATNAVTIYDTENLDQ